MTARILITRAEDDALATARRVEERGYATQIDSILRIHSCKWDDPDWSKVAAIIVTSQNALRGFEGHQLPRDKFFFTTGSRTAQALRAAGFIHNTGSVEKSDELPFPIRMQIKPEDGTLLHLTSEHAHDDFYEALKKDGYKIEVRHVYRAEESKNLQEATQQALKKGEISGVLFYSTRTAMIFQDLVRRHNLTETLGRVRAIALSAAVAAACDASLWKSVSAAEAPTHDSLMDCLAKTITPDP